MSFHFGIFIVLLFFSCDIHSFMIPKASNDEGQCLIYRKINWQIIDYFQYKQKFQSLAER